jgi:acyl transferase domain-containing protein
VSSFGFGGSNFHCVLEEATSSKTDAAWDGTVQILALAAQTQEQLIKDLENFAEILPTDSRPEHRAYQFQSTRENFRSDAPFRLAAVFTDPLKDQLRLSELIQALKSCSPLPIHCYFQKGPATGKLAYLYSGQGSQYQGMGLDLACIFPEVQQWMDRMDQAVPGLWKLIHGPNNDSQNLLSRTDHTQAALGALECGLTGVLKRFAVHPDELAGHSYGELVALWAAGYFNDDQFVKATITRGKAMAEAPSGAMAALLASAEDVEAAISSWNSEHPNSLLVAANYNAPRQIVISGSVATIDAALPWLQHRGITAKKLPVSGAFHSDSLHGASDRLKDALTATQASSKAEGFMPRARVWKNRDACPYTPQLEEPITELPRQMINAVRWTPLIENLAREGVTTFLEIGPKSVLSGLVSKILPSRSEITVLSMDSSQGRADGLLDLAAVLAQLAVLGHPLSLTAWETPVKKPRKQALTVPIRGINYRSTPAPKPRPQLAKYAVTHLTPDSAPGVSPLPLQPSANSTPLALPAKSPALPASASQTPATTTPPSAASTMTSPAPTSQSSCLAPPTSAPTAPQAASALAILQAMHERTAHAHLTFLQSVQTSQAALLSLVQGASSTSLNEVLKATIPFPAPSNTPVVSPPTSDQAQAPLPTSSPSSPAPTARSSASKFSPQPSPIAPFAPQAAAASLIPALETQKIDQALLEVVAELTGYPAEMIELTMDMESDLGIDSIKRVEILAAVQRRLPQLPPVDSTRLGSLRTLAEVRKELLSTSPPEAAPSVTTSPTSPSTISDSAITEVLLQVVAELTGYPASMIELSMDLESDLGIDSIKRVEILAAVQRALPKLPAIDSTRLGSLRTLEEILQQFETNSSSSVAPPQDSSQSNDELMPVLLQAVSDLTGYPREMIEPSMDLESDLGVDSIKRVEILAAVQKALPHLPAVDSTKLGSLRTLADIARTMASSCAVSGPAMPSSAPSSPASAPAQSAPQIAADGMLDTLLAIVAEQTGYPADMIDPAMDLEADLGIDSIKRVEILAAAQKHYPILATVDSSQLQTQSSIQAILTLVRTHAKPEPHAPTPLPSPSLVNPVQGSTASIGRQIPQWNPLTVSASKHFPLKAGSHVGLIARDQPLVQALLHILRSEGYEATLVCNNSAISMDAFIVMATDFPALTDHDQLWTEDEENRFRDLVETFLKQAALCKETGKYPELLVTLSALDGTFGLDSQRPAAFNPLSGGIAAIAKTAAQEWSSTTCVAVDLAPEVLSDPGHAASRLLTVVATAQAHRLQEVGILAESYGTISTVAMDRSQKQAALPLKSQEVILAIGGARGVTVDCLEELAQSVSAHFIVTGRTILEELPQEWSTASGDQLRDLILQEARQRGTKLTPAQLQKRLKSLNAQREVRQTLTRLVQAGAASAHYFPMDATEAHDLAKVLDNPAVKNLGPVRGLVHAAGVIEDRLIVDKTIDQYDRVVSTKVTALRKLLDLPQIRQDLRFVALFSSVSARFGNRGQLDYGIANEILNKAAQALTRRTPDLVAVSLNWGPWDGGMVTPELKRAFESRGIQCIPKQLGAQAFVAELTNAANPKQVEIVLGSGLAAPHPGSDPDNGKTQTSAPAPKSQQVPHLPAIFSRAVDVHSHPFLNSHVLGGRAVLPLAMMMEWMAHGALTQQPGLHLIELRQVRVCKGLKLNGEQVRMEVAGAPTSGPTQQSITIALELRSGQGLHATAEALLSAEPRQTLPQWSHPSASQVFEISTEDIYKNFLFHGHDFQGIIAVTHLDERGLIANAASSPVPRDWMANPVRSKWIIDPLLVDLALQSGIIFSQVQQNAPSLPSLIQSAVIVPPRGLNSDTSWTLTLAVRETAAHRLIADAFIQPTKGSGGIMLSGIHWTVDPALRNAFAHNGQTVAGHHD